MDNTKGIISKRSTGNMKMLRAMVGIGVLCALLIVLTYEKTRPIIEKNKAEALKKAIFKVIPRVTKTKAYEIMENQDVKALKEGTNAFKTIYAGYNDSDEFVGLAIEASGQGYADIIRILYGYNPKNQDIVGFYVLETKETPGLGDKIEKDEDFLANFNALDVSLTDDKKEVKNKVVTVKHGSKQEEWEIDGITGATISSRAIGDIIGNSTVEWLPTIYKQQAVFENNE